MNVIFPANVGILFILQCHACKKCYKFTYEKGKNIEHFGGISCWISTKWSVFDQCLLRFALHNTQDTRRLNTSSRRMKQMFIRATLYSQ